MENFGEVIKRKREARNWTQKQLADQLHVSPKSVSRWETNHGYPDIALLPELARILELDYRELLDGNEYIAKQRDVQNKKFRILVIGVICIAVLVGLLIVSIYKEEPQSIRNILANQEWSSIHFGSDAIHDCWYLLEEDQRDSVLDYLCFDDWEEVIMKEKDKPGFIFNTLGEVHWYMIFHAGDEQFQIRYHEYQDEYYISIEIGAISGYEIYKVSQPLVSPENYIINDMKNWYGFSNEHTINNKSTDIKEITIQESELLLLEYTLDKKELLYHDYIFIEDTDNERYYFILTSNKKDYHKIDVNIENGMIVAELMGEEKIYKNHYVHIFEVNEMFDEIAIKYNNEGVSLLNAHHISYSAKKVK